MQKTRPLAERFAEKWLPDENGCWLWQGWLDRDGYGFISPGGTGSRIQRAHRVSYEMFVAPITPKSLHVLHRCDRPACVNPDHLFLGTAKDNLVDMARKGRSKAGRGRYPPGVRRQHRKIEYPYSPPPRYDAVCGSGKRTIYLGAYATIEEAAAVAAAARQRLIDEHIAKSPETWKAGAA